MKIWTYHWRVAHDGRTFYIRLRYDTQFGEATVRIGDVPLATDRLTWLDEPFRIQTMVVQLESREYRFEIGPRSMATYGLRVSCDGQIVFQSHDEPFAAFEKVRDMFARTIAARRRGNQDVDLGKFKRNAPAILTDIALGVLFFVVAKLTDLRTAALVAAGAGLALYPIQWLLNRLLANKLDLLGGLAMFGIVMLLISAGFSWLFDSELAVQLKSTYLGLLGATFFAIDAARGAPYLGKRLALYLAYNDIDPQRLAWIFAAIGAAMAAVNAAVALVFSKDVWLWYSLWGDLILAMGLAMWALPKARRPSTTPTS